MIVSFMMRTLILINLNPQLLKVFTTAIVTTTINIIIFILLLFKLNFLIGLHRVS